MRFGTDAPRTGRERALAVAERHVESEYSNDIEQILPTVSTRDAFFPLVFAGPDGSFSAQVYEGADGPRRFYARRATEIHLEGSDNLTMVVADWYTIRHSIGTITLKEELGASRAGKLAKSPTVIVFPIADDGIVGELAWSKYDIDTCIAMTAQDADFSEVHDKPLRTQRLVEDFVAAWRAADAQRLDTLLGKDCFRVGKVVDSEYQPLSNVAYTHRESVLSSLADGPGGEVSVIAQYVTGWFAVVEYSIRQRERGTRRQVVCLYPLDSDRILGEISYAIESADA
jgi:hypothetical protein